MPKATPSNTQALQITGWLTGIYFLIELFIGFWTGSVAVISDAFHTFSAVGGVLIALIAEHLALRPATPRQTYGLLRAEIIGALFNGIFLFFMAVMVLWIGYQRLHSPIDLPTTPMLLAAAGGLITEVIALKLLYTKQKENLNMKGAFWHVLQTFVGSVLIIITAVVIHFTDFLLIDPLLGMLFGLALFGASWSIVREALHILLENVPTDIDLEEIQVAIKALPNVQDVHHLHAWALTSGKNIVSLHVLIKDMMHAEQLQREIYVLLKEEFHIYFSTVQIETQLFESPAAKKIDFTHSQ